MEEQFDIVLAKGSRVRYTEPFFTQFDLDEILIHLSNICRYNGAIKIDLLRHSILVAYLVQDMLSNNTGISYDYKYLAIAHGLIHDFQESIVGDLVTPLKKQLSEFNHLETIWTSWVQTNLNLIITNPHWEEYINKIVKAADTRALVLETNFRNHASKTRFFELYGDNKPITIWEENLITTLYSQSFETMVCKAKDIITKGQIANLNIMSNLILLNSQDTNDRSFSRIEECN